MNPAAPRSLRRWLSRGLALLTLVGLGLVCAAVYVATQLSLASRQAVSLEQHRQVIEHLVEEITAPGDLAILRHKLDDFFAGRSDLRLRLRSASGQWVYGGDGRGLLMLANEKRLVFDIASPTHRFAPMQAELGLDVASDDQLLRGLAWTLAACALTGTIAISLGGAWLVRRALEPVNELAQQAMRLVPERLAERLDGAAQAEEVQPLVQQFNAVLERLQRAYVQLEGFNADVAHELRTPLTTLIGQTELALKGKGDAAELRDIMGSNLEELHRLSSLVHDMLFLSNADTGVKARTRTISSLAALAHEVAEYHEAPLLEARLTIGIIGDAVACVDGRLVRQAMSNLLSNATRYAQPGTRIEVGIQEAAPGEVVLSVTNTGPEIAEEHLSRLFDRFYRVDTARKHGEDNNYGLGLAIVAAIARMHGGRTFARSSHGMTTIGFSVPYGDR